MKTKRLIAIAAAFGALTLPLTACSNVPGADLKVYMPDGAPALALASFMDAGYDGMEFTVVPASTIAGKFTDSADLAIMPVNAAATLFNKGAKITMLSVNTHGNLYFVGDATENMTLQSLAGKRVGVIGRGQVPDLTLRMLLDKKEIAYTVSNDAVDGKVAVRYGADGPSLLPLLKKGDIDYAFLAEPAASTAVTNFSKAIVLDAQSEWEAAFGGKYPQACLVVKNGVLEKYGDYIDGFLTDLKTADGWAENNADKAVAAIKAHAESGTESTLPDTLAKDVIARCNIETVFAADARVACENYFNTLKMMTADELGTPVLDDMPTDAFYYKWQNKE